MYDNHVPGCGCPRWVQQPWPIMYDNNLLLGSGCPFRVQLRSQKCLEEKNDSHVFLLSVWVNLTLAVLFHFCVVLLFYPKTQVTMPGSLWDALSLGYFKGTVLYHATQSWFVCVCVHISYHHGTFWKAGVCMCAGLGFTCGGLWISQAKQLSHLEQQIRWWEKCSLFTLFLTFRKITVIWKCVCMCKCAL